MQLPQTHLLTYLILALTSASVGLAAENFKDLSDKSPFLPPGYNQKEEAPPPPVVQNGPLSRELEFRGVMKWRGQYQFSIYNKKGQQSYWIKENQTIDGISVRDYNAESMSVTVLQNGRSERLEIADTSDSPLPVAVARTPSTNEITPPAPASNNDDNRRRVIPRRRVILPRN